MREREHYIDNLKAFAMAMIVLGHCNLLNNVPWLSSFIQSWHVPIFFVITGFLLWKRQEKKKEIQLTKEYFIKKIKSYMIPYFVFTILYALEVFVFSFIGNKESALNELAEDIVKIVTLNGKGAMWFLPVLLIAEIIFIFEIKKMKVLVASIINLIFSIIALELTNLLLPEISLVLFRIIIGLICINAGYLFGWAISKETFNQWLVLISSLLVYVMTFALQGDTSFALMETGKIPVLYGVEIISASIFMIQLFNIFLNKKITIVSDFGRNTIICLLTHQILIEVIYVIDNVTLNVTEKLGTALPFVLFIIVMSVEIIAIIPFFKKHLLIIVGKT